MVRKCLIIYCDNTKSGPLSGPSHDNDNFVVFLTSNLGGNWIQKDEIRSLHNPTQKKVIASISGMSDADYTLLIFTGHGRINTGHNNLQYLEVNDGEIPILALRTKASRQTIIIDACRGKEGSGKNLKKAVSEGYFSADGNASTREIYDDWIEQCEEGMIVLYSAHEDGASMDTKKGAAYLLSLLQTAYNWESDDTNQTILELNSAHLMAINLMYANFETNQKPEIKGQKRHRFFPLAVKFTMLHNKEFSKF